MAGWALGLRAWDASPHAGGAFKVSRSRGSMRCPWWSVDRPVEAVMGAVLQVGPAVAVGTERGLREWP